LPFVDVVDKLVDEVAMLLNDASEVGCCLADVVRDDDARAQARRLRGLGGGAGRECLRREVRGGEGRRGEARRGEARRGESKGC
jgi:hypothetical protein